MCLILEKLLQKLYGQPKDVRGHVVTHKPLRGEVRKGSGESCALAHSSGGWGWGTNYIWEGE